MKSLILLLPLLLIGCQETPVVEKRPSKEVYLYTKFYTKLDIDDMGSMNNLFIKKDPIYDGKAYEFSILINGQPHIDSPRCKIIDDGLQCSRESVMCSDNAHSIRIDKDDRISIKSVEIPNDNHFEMTQFWK